MMIGSMGAGGGVSFQQVSADMLNVAASDVQGGDQIQAVQGNQDIGPGSMPLASIGESDAGITDHNLLSHNTWELMMIDYLTEKEEKNPDEILQALTAGLAIEMYEMISALQNGAQIGGIGEGGLSADVGDGNNSGSPGFGGVIV